MQDVYHVAVVLAPVRQQRGDHSAGGGDVDDGEGAVCVFVLRVDQDEGGLCLMGG